MAYTLTTALQSDAAGQTLSAQLVDTTGANVGSAVATGFHDLGAAFYMWTYAAFPDGFRGVVKFSVGGVLKTIVAINPQEGENVDLKVSTRASAGIAVVAVNAPVASDLRIPELVRGDDYRGVDNRRLPWRAAGWPDLTGAAIVFTARKGSDVLTVTGAVIAASADPTATQEVGVEIAGTATAGLQVGLYKYDVQATLANGDVVTLARSTMTLVEDQTI